MANPKKSICAFQRAFSSSKVLQLAAGPSFGVAVSDAVEMITKPSSESCVYGFLSFILIIIHTKL